MSKSVDLSNHNPQKVLIAGDWHRNPHAAFPKRVIKLAEHLGIDTILQVGDFGYRYGSDDARDFEKPLHLALAKAGVTLVWIDGNHENHDYLRSLPRLESGFAQTGSRGGIFYAPRGHRWNWTGRDFGALGGAWSINWQKLQEGKTVFKELEELTWEDFVRLGPEPLDYLLAHDVPRRVSLRGLNGLPRLKTTTSEILQKATDATRPLRVFSGHWHERKNFQIPRADGGYSEGHILNREFTEGNVVILNLETNELTPPPAGWLNYI